MIRRFALLLCVLSLTACGRPDETFVHIGDFEGAVGEAIVRHLIKTAPDLLPGTPKEYCVVSGSLIKAEHPHSVATDFTKRMADMNVHFVSADVLIEAPPNHDIIDPQTRIIPYIIQLATMRRPEPTLWEVEAAWSFQKTFERRRYQVRVDADGKPIELKELEKLEGNYAKPQQAPAAVPIKP
jgi:hypothetical protein